PSSSVQTTTKLPILHSVFFSQQPSIFLHSLPSSSLALRAKIIATGLAPLEQYRQFFLPACDPVTFSGWNGPARSSPTCGPDLIVSAFVATATPAARTTTSAKARTCDSFMVSFSLSSGLHTQPWNDSPSGHHPRADISARTTGQAAT